MAAQQTRTELVLSPLATQKTLEKGLRSPGNAQQKKIKAGCDSIAILDNLGHVSPSNKMQCSLPLISGMRWQWTSMELLRGVYHAIECDVYMFYCNGLVYLYGIV